MTSFANINTINCLNEDSYNELWLKKEKYPVKVEFASYQTSTVKAAILIPK